MINPNKFIFHSDFNYLPTKFTEETVMPTGLTQQQAAGLFLLKSGVVGTPFITVAGIYNNTIYTGQANAAFPPVEPVIRNGNLYGRYGGFYQKVRWRIHAD